MNPEQKAHHEGDAADVTPLDLHMPQQMPIEHVNLLTRRNQEHRIHVERAALRADLEQQHQTWRSCCFKLDKRAVAQFSQLFIGIGILLFCIAMIITRANGVNDVYFAFIGLICGFQFGRVSSW
jgi:hypothetical protein